MATIFEQKPYRYYVVSTQVVRDPILFIDRENASAQFSLHPVNLVWSTGFGMRELEKLQSHVKQNEKIFVQECLCSHQPEVDSRIEEIVVTDNVITLKLYDSRTLSIPLSWFPKLLHANDKQRSHWIICNAGYGIHWPYIGEDLSVLALMGI